MRNFIVVYACNMENGRPCPDARARCRKAIMVAFENQGTIVIGVGPYPGEMSTRYADALVAYLSELGWPRDRIIVNPSGWSTVWETVAAFEAIKQNGDGNIFVVSAWYHTPRIRLIWSLVYKRAVSVRASRRTYPFTQLVRELFAYPLTLVKIIIARRRLALK